jgi:hypothetical protein
MIFGPKYLFCFILMVALSPLARADIGLLLNGSVNAGASEYTSAGHSAVYLSRICPASPVKLRLCEPGEQGSVIGSYNSFGENGSPDWNVVPLSIFLYGVEDADKAPLVTTAGLREALQDTYRLKYLQGLCDTPYCIKNKKAHWRDLVGEGFVREIYSFQVRTSLEQDERFIEQFNARANVNHYNGFMNNCADFAMLVINMYFPGAAKPDHINDFGMTSPKAIARSFTHFAVKHPELHFHVARYAQLPGDFKHSSDCRKGTEVAFRSKKWFFPMLLRSNELVLFTTAYLLTGRFNPHRELARRPSEEAGELMQEMKTLQKSADQEAEMLETRLAAERKLVLGNDQDWDKYRDHFEELLGSAVAAGVVADRRELEKFIHDLSEKGHAYVAEDGALWMTVKIPSGQRKLGVSAQTIFAPGSDRELATKLMLARIDAVLRQQKKYRESLPEFATNWSLMETILRETMAETKGGAEGSIAGGAQRSATGSAANLRP